MGFTGLLVRPTRRDLFAPRDRVFAVTIYSGVQDTVVSTAVQEHCVVRYRGRTAENQNQERLEELLLAVLLSPDCAIEE